ncbi:MAG: GrpB family protein [Clostridiales Family XIII bacterium]|jgi:GrpB-like predicted nucleotidyltransferase (UPF0157 family)|nr:GrpB family protein [Clostridiales Family XIII bacterium]
MVIEEYNENWVKDFGQIKEVLETNLTHIIAIEHVGSTAIIGMCAKPIIDIDLVIDNNTYFEQTRTELEALGYSHEGDLGIAGREAFERNNVKNEVLDKINHHLYVCAKDNEELKRHIVFRDYLNAHYEALTEYRDIKKSIVEKYGNDDRGKYVSVKEAEYGWFFERIIKEAEREFAVSGNWD